VFSEAINVLLVEDNPGDARLVQLALTESQSVLFDTKHVDRIGAALQCLKQQKFQAVLLDLSLPDSTGLDTLQQILQADSSVPIIVMSGMHDEDLALQAVQGGAQDYLVKGQENGNGNVISRAIRYAMERKRSEEALLQASHELEQRVKDRTADLTAANKRLLEEVTERKRAEDALRKSQLELRLRNESLQTINEIADRLYHSLDYWTVIEHAVESMMHYSQSPSVVIFTVNEKEKCLELAHARGFDHETVDKSKRLAIEGSLTGQTVMDRKIMVSEDLLTDERVDPNSRHLMQTKPFRSVVSVPVLFRDRALGAINLLFRSRHCITDEEQETLLSIGKTVGLAMANANHLDQLKTEMAERKRAEDKERQRMMELAHVTRLSTMGEMATEIAHEVNQPLTAITNYSSACVRMLTSNSENPEEIIDALKEITRQAQRAGEVIRRLREFVAKDDSHRSTNDINEVMRSVFSLAQVEARWHAVDLEIQLAEALPHVLVNKILIEQVALNLIRNAIEAMNGIEINNRTVTIKTMPHINESIMVVVEDFGPGLSEEALLRIFEPFYTTKPSGMGMGLAICKSIIEAHGGQLWAMQNKPAGAKFQFTLPLSQGEK
jgi:C4-dicarboxylate-specific signal transduction histidine kinase